MTPTTLLRSSLVAGVVAFLGILATAAPNQLHADDGWRRTAQGWEHVSTWKFASKSPQQNRSLSYDPPQVVHPLFLVAFQGGLSVLALAAVNSPQIRR